MSDDILKRIESKIDILDTRIDSVDVTLGKQEVAITEHIRRTNLLEDGQTVIFNEIKPLKEHVNQVNGVLKFIGILASIATIVTVILRISGKI